MSDQIYSLIQLAIWVAAVLVLIWLLTRRPS